MGEKVGCGQKFHGSSHASVTAKRGDNLLFSLTNKVQVKEDRSRDAWGFRLSDSER